VYFVEEDALSSLEHDRTTFAKGAKEDLFGDDHVLDQKWLELLEPDIWRGRIPKDPKLCSKGGIFQREAA